MKKLLCWLLVFTMAFAAIPQTFASADDPATMILPAGAEIIGEEAFCGDTAVETLIIPKEVNSIGPRAFADCSNLAEVYFGKNESVSIAADAFSGVENPCFYVYTGTPAELYALSHGFDYRPLDEGSEGFARASALVAANGGVSILQSGTFSSKRLIVQRRGDRLPDISAFEPVEILHEGSLFIIQFADVGQTQDCYTMLYNDAGTVFVEADESVQTLDDVSAAGVVDPEYWDTDDPMGFDEYSQFVAENGVGGITVAVVDSGVAANSSYASKLRSDGANMLQAIDGMTPYADSQRHGSVIASVISDCTGNANVSILPVRVVGANGNTDFILLGQGILYAVEHGASIINISLNFKQSAYVTYCINQAVAAGAIVTVASGNASRSIADVYPANLPNVITVSGLNTKYTLSSNSNYGEGVDYCAPDSLIKTSAYSSANFNGTSFSAPMVASAYALVALDPYHTVDDLVASCSMPDETGKPANSYGKGLMHLDTIANIAAESLVIDSSVPSVLTVGQSVPLSWTVLPENATDKTASAVSDDESIVSVSKGEDGTVTLKAESTGTATVTLSSNSNSSVSASRTFTVVKPVSTISITGAESTLPLTRTMRLTAAVTPADATDSSIEWVSSNTDVATVSVSGVVTPKAVGTVQIYARALDGYGAQSAPVTIEVQENPDAEGIVLTIGGEIVTGGTIRMNVGESVSMQTSVLPADADQEVSFRVSGGTRVTVSSSDSRNCTITANSSGTAYVTVASKDDPDVYTELGIIVAVSPTSVTVAGNTVINEGATGTMTATVLPSNATDKTVTWSSSDTSVATVSSSGIVTGIKNGTAVITAVCNGNKSVSSSVTVTVKHPFTLAFDPNGGTLGGTASKQLFSGDAYGTLSSASRDYFTFDGWYTAASGGTKVSESDIVTTEASTVTLYAHWILPEYTVSWNAPANGSISVQRTSTLSSAGTGALANGAKIYSGDTITVSYGAATGYRILSNGITSATVTRSFTSGDIYLNTIQNTYTYSVLYRSSNGTDLGSSSYTGTWGYSYTISAPAKAGYDTPDNQYVTWDAASKTITFTYTPTAVATSQTVASGNWFDRSWLTWTAYAEYQNRTANSVQVRIHWHQNIKANYGYGYNTYFTPTIGGQAQSKLTIASGTENSLSSKARTADKYSSWVTVSLSTTNATSVAVSSKYSDSNGNNTKTGSWSGSVSIPAF